MNKCVSCGKEISKVSIRCKSCSNKFRKGKYKVKNHHRPKGLKYNYKNKKVGKEHHRWKGDKVGYGALHIWIRKNKPKPELCEECGKKKKLEIANISGKYKRDINDYKWLCRSCHQKFDGRKSLMGKYKYCKFCKNRFYYKYGEGKTNWNKRQFCCRKCSPKEKGKNGRFKTID